ncbi:MAG: DUF1592 domain-containing protein [Phycisphaeraceae bacterium]
MSVVRVSVCVCILFASGIVFAEESGDTFLRDVQPMLSRYCFGCHGESKQTSGVRFDQLKQYRPQESPLWTKVHEAVSSGEMPPQDKPQPTAAQKAQLLNWIAARQREAAGTIRRLNRRETSAALRDLTGLSVQFADGLPGDGRVGGFDTGADGLQDAADSVAALMTVTRRAVDGIRFLEPSSGAIYQTILRASADPKKALDGWKAKGARAEPRGPMQKGKGLLMEPQWVGDRDSTDFILPVPPQGKGILRVTIDVSLYKPMPGLPNPKLWVSVSGKDIDHREITADFENPQVLTYEVQLEDLAIEARGVRVSISNRIEIPYSIDGFENEETNRPDEVVPGGTGWYRPKFDRKLPPEQKPAPYIVLQRVSIKMGYRTAWPTAPWKAGLAEITDSDASAKQLLSLWGQRAWRRPVSEKEQERFFALYQKLRGQRLSFDEALRAAFQSMLMSSGFRYLASPGDSDKTIAQHAIASRLSFMLWGAPPDSELLQLAAEGKLREPAVLDAQVDRLLADPRSDGFVRPFVLQWLEMEQPITIASTSLKKQDFRFARNLKDSMREETLAYIARLFVENKPARELIASDWTMMNDALAIHYGYKGVEGGLLRPIKLRADDPRGGGVLGHAGIQSMLTWMGSNWVIYRGAWTLRHILDDAPPPPPLEVPELNASEGSNKGKPFRELLKQHQEDVNCSVCHRKMDPMGFAFQNFDISGRWREVEHESYQMADLDGKIEWRGIGAERPVDAVGRLPRGEAFKSYEECKQLIIRHYLPDVMRGLLKNLVVYGTGRLPDVHDLALIKRILEQHESDGYPLRDVLKSLVRSEIFLGR